MTQTTEPNQTDPFSQEPRSRSGFSVRLRSRIMAGLVLVVPIWFTYVVVMLVFRLMRDAFRRWLVNGCAVQLLGQLPAARLSDSPARHGRKLRRQHRRPHDRHLRSAVDELVDNNGARPLDGRILELAQQPAQFHPANPPPRIHVSPNRPISLMSINCTLHTFLQQRPRCRASVAA